MERSSAMPKEIAIPSWNDFTVAVGVFENDYGIVGHSGEPRKGFFDTPRDHMQYTVTGAELGSEEEFLAQLKKSPVSVFIECMDRRGANLAYKKVVEEILPQEELENTQVFHFAAGGGVIQRDVVVRDGSEVVVNRGKAFSTIMQYLAEHAHVVKVIATDHDCRCGAEAFAADGKGWPERLGCSPGDEAERKQMKQLINEYTDSLLPEAWKQNGIVDTYLVEFSQHPETEAKVVFEKTR